MALTNMERAAREFFISCYDPVGQHKTPSDLAWSMLHELDLHAEGEENELDTPAKVRRAKKYIAKWENING